MRYVRLSEAQIREIAEHYNLDVEPMLKNGVILYEDGTMWYEKNLNSSPMCNADLSQDFNYYVLQEYINTMGHHHTQEQLNYLKSLDATEIELRENDIYVYDPLHKLGISLGDMGDGWVCLYENYF